MARTLDGWVPLFVAAAVLLVALALLRSRRRPTVWSNTIVRALLVASGALAFALNPGGVPSVLLAIALFGAAALITFRSRSFLLLFARPGAFTTVEETLRKLGVQ